MFLTFFPTKLKDIPTDSLYIDNNFSRKNMFYSTLSHRHEHLDDQNPAAVFVNNIFIPIVSGIIGVENSQEDPLTTPTSVICDVEEGTFDAVLPIGRPSKFKNAYGFTKPLTINKEFLNHLMRALNFKLKISIQSPHYVELIFKDDECESHSFNRTFDNKISDFIALVDGEWVRVINGKMYSTEDEKHLGDFDPNKATIHYCTNYVSDFDFDRAANFKFMDVTSDNYWRGRNTMFINIPCEATDPNVGEIIFKTLGITDFDNYGEINIVKNDIDPADLTVGKHWFGLVKTKARVFNTEKFDKFLEDNNPEKKKGFGDFLRSTIYTKSMVRKNFVQVGTDVDLDISTAQVLMNNWTIRNCVFAIMDQRKIGGSTVVDKLTSSVELFTEPTPISDSDKETFDAQALAIIKEFTKVIDVQIPITTPRLTDEINARINHVIKKEKLKLALTSFTIPNPYMGIEGGVSFF